MSMRLMPFVVAALLGVAAAGLVSCGSGGGDGRRQLIPQRSADRLKSALSDVRSAVDDGDCDAAQRAVTRARGVLVNLPESVNDRLVTRLRQGIDNLGTVAPRECAQQSTQTETQETTTTTATTTETTPTETTPTDTTPTTTTQTSTTTTPSDTTTTAPPATTTTEPADPSGGTTTP